MKSSAVSKEKTLVLSGEPEPVKLSDGDFITVKEITFRSKEAHDYLSAAEDVRDAFVKAVITGAVALERAQTSVDVDYVGRQMNEMLTKIQENLVKMIDPLSDGSLGKKLSEIIKIQNENLKSYVSQGQESTHQLDQRINQFTDTIRTELDKAIVNQLVDEKGRVGMVLKQLKTEINELRDSIISDKTRKASAAPAIGIAFEESCQAVLEEVCNSHSLILEDLRNKAELNNSKVGDYRVSGFGIKPIVIEVKNRDTKLSLNSVLKELDNAAKNRSCGLAIFVASQQCVPVEASPINFYASQNRYAVCEEGTFKTALRIMISHARIDYETTRPDSEIDLTKVIASVKEIQASLLKFKVFKNNCIVIKKSSMKIEDAAAALKAEIEDNIEDLLEHLNGDKGEHNE